MLKLGSAGSIKGRLLDADGKPLTGMAVEILYGDGEATAVHRITHKEKHVVTDRKGAFRIDGLVTECRFVVVSLHRGKPLAEAVSTRRQPIVHEVKPGECSDLGAIKLKSLPQDGDK